MANLRAVCISAGPHGGKFLEGKVIVIEAENGTPLVGLEVFGDALTVVCTHEKPEQMEAFLKRHGYVSMKLSTARVRLQD